jgi:hypothetical protein
MRAFVVTAVLLSIAAPAAAAGADSMFAERSALLAADRRCALFTPQMRQALEASTFQARGVLLRAGWTAARADALSRGAAREVSARRCDDPVLLKAASDARFGFSGWTRLMGMTFPGGERTWSARRAADPQGFYIRQDIPTPRPAVFGVRREGNGGSLMLVMALNPGEAAPSTARLSFRDTARAPRSIADTPGRLGHGLASLTASPATARVTHAQARAIETGEKGARAVVFTFPDAALYTMKGLDPREAMTITLEGRQTITLLVEVGDIAAAHAFLAAEAVG